MPHHLISDAHEQINDIPTVPIYRLAKPPPRERAVVLGKEVGKEDPVEHCEGTLKVERSEAATLPSSAKVAAVGEAGLLGSSTQRRHARTSTVRSEDTIGRGV